MATFIGIGYSKKTDWQEAAFEASLMVRKQLNSDNADLIILLTTAHYCRPEILPAIRSVITSQKLIGSSAAAIILPDQILHKGIGLLAIKSDTINFTSHSAAINTNTHLRTMGFEMMRTLIKDHPTQRQGCLLFGDGFYRNSQDFLHGAGEVLGFSSALTGGISSIENQHKKLFQFHNDKILEGHIVATLANGPCRFHVQSCHSFKVLGKPRVATKVSDYVLRTIDDKPAVSIYEEFLNVPASYIRQDHARLYQLYPLGFYNEPTGRYLLRNPVDILADGSIVFYGDIPQGAETHIMISNKDACLQNALDASIAIRDAVADKTIELLFIMESTSRARILGRNALQEISLIRETLGFTVPLFGMYSFGEVSPWLTASGNKLLGLHNGGLVLTAIT